MRPAPGATRWERVRAALGVYKHIKRQRASLRARAMHQLAQQLLDGQQQAAVAVVMAASAAEAAPRRSVERALGKWRGSTIGGYLRGDDTTYLANFRCTKLRFDDLLAKLRGSCFASGVEHATYRPHAGARLTTKARSRLDPPDLRFKLAMCMYALGQQGGSTKVLADVGSIGESTLRRWLGAFARAVMTLLKPIYMPGKPYPESEREAVQDQFASRRGLHRCTLACDGSHIPFKPKNKKVAMDYRNYKGWYSILSVAFVDSYYRFFDVHVGYPGRAGDNTVLARWELMAAMRNDPELWLGPGGVVLGDSGASDNDTLFLNPYHNPGAHEPEKSWFNFCHSSSRFFVEQTFGMWKSRFRFLLGATQGLNHALASQLIFASAVLHNYLVVHSGDKIESGVSEPEWARFFETFKAHMCPSCKRDGLAHCVHQAVYRNGAAQMRAARKKPSVKRDEDCARMWDEVSAGPDAARIRAEMHERVTVCRGAGSTLRNS